MSCKIIELRHGTKPDTLSNSEITDNIYDIIGYCKLHNQKAKLAALITCLQGLSALTDPSADNGIYANKNMDILSNNAIDILSNTIDNIKLQSNAEHNLLGLDLLLNHLKSLIIK